MTVTEALSTLREWAHALIAILGVLATSGGLIVMFLAVIGVHGLDVQVAAFTSGCGSAVVLLSKAIDSLNNALASPSVGTTVTSGTVNATPIGAGVPA